MRKHAGAVERIIGVDVAHAEVMLGIEVMIAFNHVGGLMVVVRVYSAEVVIEGGLRGRVWNKTQNAQRSRTDLILRNHIAGERRARGRCVGQLPRRAWIVDSLGVSR